MNLRQRFGFGAATIGCFLVTGLWSASHVTTARSQQDDRDQPPARPEGGRDDIPLREFMRAKLEASNSILEGLVTEDHALIRDGAQKLNEMTTAERWRVQNDAMYRQFSSEFRRTTQDLVKAADDGNLDQAALQWMDATMSCIECHRYVRGMRVADADDQSAGEDR